MNHHMSQSYIYYFSLNKSYDRRISYILFNINIYITIYFIYLFHIETKNIFNNYFYIPNIRKLRSHLLENNHIPLVFHLFFNTFSHKSCYHIIHTHCAHIETIFLNTLKLKIRIVNLI